MSLGDSQPGTQNGIARLLERHRAFWHCTPVDRPLLNVKPWRVYAFYEPFPLTGGRLATERIELRPGLIDIHDYLQRARPPGPTDGDFFDAWTPYDVCWMESILGCVPVAESGTTWAKPFIDEWEQVTRVLDAGPTGWLDELIDVHVALAAMADGSVPAGQPLMRGPADMALASMSSEMFCEGFYEHPDELDSLLRHCTQLRLEAAHRRIEAAPSFHEGYCGRDVWGLWAPGPLLDVQEDACGLLSPKVYKDFIAPLDREMVQQFDYSVMHLHSGQLQMLPAMLEIPELTAIQIAIDPPPYGPPAGGLIPGFESVQTAGKSLLLTGPVTQTELDAILSELTPVGLALRLELLPVDPEA